MNPDVPPAKKRVRNRAPKPVMPKPEVIRAPCPAVTHDRDDAIPPKPEEDTSKGEKTPAIIRWRLKFYPETMAAIYRSWNWQAWLDQNPE